MRYAPKHGAHSMQLAPDRSLDRLCLSAGVVAIMSNLPEEDFLSWGGRRLRRQHPAGSRSGSISACASSRLRIYPRQGARRETKIPSSR